ncbi:serine/threonine protein kinase related protein-putative PQQ-dependent oxidoreductase-like protein [Blastopirellula marina DSM 3645]|uniref:Serine/threonine protein kinase related protein-putative PQQ-dependent oxidoreductase-like protein n=2 Tax=Blastopirellula marina TaxID=124 RepID=A4A0R2_9BACT|nr:serine/threonine protein kinase related protein-putative PQQ-dependent oxidoreductase-like protein [Blastopirellula marina DSM 3645]
MMNIPEFLDLLEMYEYLAENQIAALRRQLAQMDRDVTPEQIVNSLLQRGHLTKYQAKRVLAEAQSGKSQRTQSVSSGRRRAQEKWLSSTPVEEEIMDLGEGDLVPLDEDGSSAFDDVIGDDVLSDQDDLAPIGDAASGKRKKYVKKAQRKNRWDSPLLLFGGAGLVLLVLAGGLLFAWLSWDSGDSVFQLAETDYEGRKYAQAVSKYDKFLSSFPTHSQAPTARVRRGLANLRLAIEGTNNYEQALTRTTEILNELKDEPEFALARPELASLLPDVANGLAQAAIAEDATAKRRELVARAQEAMTLVDDSNYLPTSLRSGQQTRIDGIVADIHRVERGISRDEELAAAVTDIQTAAQSDDFEAVYRRRQTLLRVYPSLSDDPRLQDAVRNAVTALEARVIVSAENVPATRQDHPLGQARTVMIAARTSSVSPQPAKEAVTVVLDGAIYGLDRRAGSPLWRRFLGFSNQVEPLMTSDQSAVIAASSLRQELVKLNALTGELAWRFPLTEEVVQLLALGDDFLVVTKQGKLLRLNQKSGDQTQSVQLPQQIAVAAVVSKMPQRVMVVGLHSTLYVLDAKSLTCEQAIFLGHEAGAIVSPPVMSELGHLCLFENAGSDFSLLHVLGNKEKSLEQLQPPTRLPGLVLAPALTFQSRVAAANDRGALFVFEGGMTKENPVRLLAQTKTERGDRLYSLIALENGYLWVGDNRLSRYALQLSQQSIVPRVVEFDRDNFVSLRIDGDLLIHVRRPAQGGGVIVTAADLNESGAKQRWLTTLAAPLTGPAFAMAPQQPPLVMTSRGDLFEITSTAVQSGVADAPSDSANYVSPPRLDRQVFVADKRRLFLSAPPENRAVYFDAARSGSLLKQLTLEVPSDSITSGAVLAGVGVVAPSSQGQVFYLDPATGAAAALPFQPRLALGENLDWNEPVADGQAAIVFDGRQTLYRLQADDPTTPQLASVAECVIDGKLGPIMAVMGPTLLAKQIGDTTDQLVFVSLPDLQSVQKVPIEARIIAGPFAVGDRAIVQTSQGVLIAYGADQQEHWRVPTETSVLVGEPIYADDRIIVTCADGRVLQIDATSGEVAKTIQLDEPLTGGVALHDGKLWINGYGGVVHVLDWK